jgi:L-2,4-diaminobutyrate decarboxylase
MKRLEELDSEAAALAALEQDARPEAGTPFVALAASYYTGAWAGGRGVAPAEIPEAVAARLAEPPPVLGGSLDGLLQRLDRDVLAHSNRLADPMAMGHQVSPPLPAGVWVEPVISALNQSLAVREMSPAGTIVERSLVRWLAGLAGLGPAAGGTFTSGGTEANFTALLAARAAVIPEAWLRGVGADPPVLVCGEHAHYSVARSAGELGLGVDNVVAVPSRGLRMDAAALPAVLDAVVSGGRSVLAVVASAGSTATGTFDDLALVADACGGRGIWFHVDAAHGGSALLSDTHRHRLRGIERADSLAWDPHKMMLLPIPCSVVLVRHEARLDAAFTQTAPYLFRGPAGVRPEDQGVRSFACSRRLEALKLWAVLQRYGTAGVAALYDRLCRMTRTLHDRLQVHPAFVPLHRPESNILCFRWTGEPGWLADACADHLDVINLELREAWNASGDGWITTTMLEGRRVLRVTIMNPRTTETHLEALLHGLDTAARRLAIVQRLTG